MLRRITHALMFGWLDHLLGGVFAMFKWLLALSITAQSVVSGISGQQYIHYLYTLMDGDMLPWVMKIAPKMFGIVIGTESVAMPDLI